MRNILPVSAALFSIAFALPAVAQTSQWAHEPGTGQSGPASDRASNISGSDSRSPIAPHFQSPEVGENAGPVGYLKAAEKALAHRRTGEAQQALEMAETRLLDRSMPADASSQPSQNAMVQQVSMARQALGRQDIQGARTAIAAAIADSPMARHNAEENGAAMRPGEAPAPGMLR